MKKSALLIVGGLFAVSAQAASINENFDSYALGEYDHALTNAASIGASSWVTSTVTDIVDAKFGDAGNHALHIGEKLKKGPNGVVFAGDAISGAGRFSAKFNYQYSTFILGLQQGTSGVGPWIQAEIYDGKPTLTYYVNGTGSVKFDNPMSLNKNHELVVDFNTDTDTFTGTLNGEPLTSGGGKVTTFAFRASASSINSVYVGIKTEREAWVDDIKMDAVAAQ
ncbi:MAG: hypothetical protein IT583_00890 [Verrucomicrobia bacterium]|nr:hypothetical protein [Verrucomicrobiota bacterium]